MNIIYWDTIGGISGDMMLAALVDTMGSDDFLVTELKKLPLNPWQWQRKRLNKGAFDGEKIDFIIAKEQPQRHLSEIETIVKAANYKKNITGKILEIFDLLAVAESKAHGIMKEEVHFHEVGADDTILDIAGTVLLLDHLNIDKIYSSPLIVGGGLSTGCHGLMPHPAPALNYLLEGVKVCGTEENGETITPTGIAILKGYNAEFGAMPTMTIKKVGTGCGTKDWQRPNILRCFFGASEETESDIYRIEATVDDMTGEELGFLWQKVFEAGATDMNYTTIHMKKGRPGEKITVLVAGEKLEDVRHCLFKHTTTIGLICQKVQRMVMNRNSVTIDTPLGKINYKEATGYGVNKAKPEYEYMAAIAERESIPLFKVQEIAEKTYLETLKGK